MVPEQSEGQFAENADSAESLDEATIGLHRGYASLPL